MAALGDQIIEPAVVLSAHGQPVLLGLRPQLLTACTGTSGLGGYPKTFWGEVVLSTPTGERLVVEARVDISFNFATGFFFDFEIERLLC